MSMKALVTGASGFIGSTLIEELGTLGFEVHALMRKTSSAANLEGLKYKRVEGDLSNADSLRRAVRDVDYVFHLAGATTAPKRVTYFEHNAKGTQRLAQAVAEERPGLTRFVFVSSLAAAGPAQSLQPKTERDDEHPVSAYGQSKLEAERELLKFKDVFPISIVRPPIVYGPRDKGILIFVQTLAKNLMPLMQGSTQDKHKYYSAIHVRDLVRGIVQTGVASKEKVPSGEIFYLADNRFYTWNEVLSSIAERLNVEPMRIRVPKFALALAAASLTAASVVSRRNFPLNLDKLNELLPDYWICSNEKAKRMLGFEPEFDLGTGMSNAIEWYKRQKWI